MKRVVPFFVLFAWFAVSGAVAQEIRINDDAGAAEQKRPVVAIHPNGPAVICWEDERNGRDEIYMQLFGRKGLPFSGNRPLDADNVVPNEAGPDVAMDDYGRFVVVYTTTVDDVYEVCHQRFYANGVAVYASTVVPGEEHRLFNTSPAVAMSSAGSFVIVWTRNMTDIYAKIYDPRLLLSGDDIAVHPPTDGLQSNPDVAMHDDNSFMVVWEDMRTGVPRIWGRLFDGDGAPIADPFEVSAVPNGGDICHHPSVVAGKNGDYFVVWGNLATETVMGARFSRTGARLGDILTLSDVSAFQYARTPRAAVHPRFDLYQYLWVGTQASEWHLYTDYYAPGEAIPLAPRQVDAGAVDPFDYDIGMADYFNTVFTWADKRRGDNDVYAAWQGQRMPMRTTAGSGFDGMVPISWDPPYGYTATTAYHIHRINPDGSRERIATVDPASRAWPGEMLDFIDENVVNGRTYRYGVQLDGERDDLIVFAEATPNAGGRMLRSRWAGTKPTIDGRFGMEEWMDGRQIADFANPLVYAPVFCYVKNDSNYLYIGIVDANDRLLDAGNTLGLLFDENNDGEWESAFSLGEGLITLTDAAQTFFPYVGRYPDELHFLAPQTASHIDFAASDDLGTVVYECRIDLHNSPLTAAPGDTIGLALWIQDPSTFFAHGYGNTGEWPRDALWDAAKTLGDFVLADGFTGYVLPLEGRLLSQLRTLNMDGGEDDELLALTGEAGDEDKCTLFGLKWQGEQFLPLQLSPVMDGFPMDMQIADVDADGLVDVLVSCDGVKWIRQTEGGVDPPVDIIDFNFGRPFVVHDFDGDGLVDIIGSEAEIDPSRRILVYRQNADHTFTLVDSLGDGPGAYRIDVLDCNGDGRPDLLAAGKYTGNIIVFENNGGFDFSPVFSDSVSERITAVETGDFDGDGYDDFVVSVEHGNIRVFHNQGDGRFVEKYAGSAFDVCFALEAVDLDRDAQLDLVSVPLFSGPVLYHNIGAVDFKEIDGGVNSAMNICVATGDFDGNGVIDIAYGGDALETLFDAALRFGVPTSVSAQKTPEMPSAFRLHQNYPNPFNPTTTIEFDVAGPSHVELTVFDMLGRRIAVLVNERCEAGRYKAAFDARRFASGVYFYRIRMGDFQQTRKMLLVR